MSTTISSASATSYHVHSLEPYNYSIQVTSFIQLLPVKLVTARMFTKVENFISSAWLRAPQYKTHCIRHPLPLPPEIILLILRYLSTADALQVALTSFHFKFLAEEHIYRHINLTGCRVRTALFLITLQQRPELGSFIETISAWRTSHPVKYEEFELACSYPARKKFLRILHPSQWNRSLCEASKLRAMDVTLDMYDYQPPLKGGPVRHIAAASDRLETLALRWWTFSKPTFVSRSPIPYADIARLLGYHTSITHLEISGILNIDPLLRTDIPNLHTIVAHCRVAAAIIPGRPVQSITALHYTEPGGDEIDVYAVYSTFAQSTVPVTYLKVDLEDRIAPIHNLTGMLMQYFAWRLPHLEHLAFLRDSGFCTRLEDVDYAAISSLRSLHTLEFLFEREFYALGTPHRPGPDLFPYSPSLREVYTLEGRFTRESQEVATTTSTLPPDPTSFTSPSIPFDKDLPESILVDLCAEYNRKTANPYSPIPRWFVFLIVLTEVLICVWIHHDAAMEWATPLLNKMKAQLISNNFQ